MTRPDVSSIVRGWLESNGYDGLFAAGECACLVSDLAPCGEFPWDCEPGYRVPMPPDRAAYYGADPDDPHAFLIVRHQPEGK